jgi:hypothetical protein
VIISAGVGGIFVSVVDMGFASRVKHASCKLKRLDFLKKLFRYLNFKAFGNRSHFGWLNANSK